MPLSTAQLAPRLHASAVFPERRWSAAAGSWAEDGDPPRLRCLYARPTPLLVALALVLLLAQSSPAAATSRFEPLRIYAHYDDATLKRLPENASAVLRRMVGLVTDRFGHMLRVKRAATAETLVLSEEKCGESISCSKMKKLMCNNFKIPETLLMQKNTPKQRSVIARRSTDFLLLVRVMETDKCNSEMTQWVQATVCTSTWRPTSGLLTYCPRRVHLRHLPALLAATVRALVNVLAFQRDLLLRLFPTTPCPLRLVKSGNCVWGTSALRTGAQLVAVSTVSVRKFIADHTGARRLRGVPLSGAGDAWDSRMMFTSVLADSPITPSLAPFLRLDKATLGLLVDSGWFQLADLTAGDQLLWGRGYTAAWPGASCATACQMGACNSTDAPSRLCFQLGPPSAQCLVCHSLGRLQVVNGTACRVESCSAADRSYRLKCVSGSETVCNDSTAMSGCQNFDSYCAPTAVGPRGFLGDLALRYLNRWPPPPTKGPTSVHPPHNPSSMKPVNYEQAYKFAFVFRELEYSLVVTKQLGSDVSDQVTQIVMQILNISDPSAVSVYKISKGSTVVHFKVMTRTYSARFIFSKLQYAVTHEKVVLTLKGVKYFATSLNSYDYTPQKAYVTEIIVGTTLGALLIIGVVSIVVILIIKKINRSQSTVTPTVDIPSSELDSVYRSNSLQTVSVASYAHVYEMRLDRSSRSIRAASLRNVSVSELGGRHRRSVSHSDDDTNV